MFTKTKKQSDLEVFTIHDSVTGSYRIPAYAINKHDMIRQIENLFKDESQKKNELITNAEHFSIFKVGEYDRKTGMLTSLNHEHVANFIDIKTSLKLQ